MPPEHGTKATGISLLAAAALLRYSGCQRTSRIDGYPPGSNSSNLMVQQPPFQYANRHWLSMPVLDQPCLLLSSALPTMELLTFTDLEGTGCRPAPSFSANGVPGKGNCKRRQNDAHPSEPIHVSPGNCQTLEKRRLTTNCCFHPQRDSLARDSTPLSRTNAANCSLCGLTITTIPKVNQKIVLKVVR